MMKQVTSLNRSGKAPEPVSPGQSDIIPADPSAEFWNLTVILMTSNGLLVSADPISAGLEGALQWGTPEIKSYKVYAMLCTSVADRQFGGAEAGSGSGSDPFVGAVKCGKVYYVGIVSSLSRSFEHDGKTWVTLDFDMGPDMSRSPSDYPQVMLYTRHVNAMYLDYETLYNHDLVLCPAFDVRTLDAPDVRQWTCGLSEAPTASAVNSTVSCDDSWGSVSTYFATVFPMGTVQPLPAASENIIGAFVGIIPSTQAGPQYVLQSVISHPLAYSFASKSFYWLCVGYQVSVHSSNFYVLQVGDPWRVLTGVQDACGISIGPMIEGS